MAARRGTSFSLKDLSSVDKIGGKITAAVGFVDDRLEAKMLQAIAMVATIARQKRPYITKAQAKAEGRRKLSKGRYQLVSDPDALAGVPVAFLNGGALQSSIKTEYKMTGGKHVGRVYVDEPGSEYANFLEFGTSRMAARPFMRPAINLTQDAIKALFRKKLS